MARIFTPLLLSAVILVGCANPAGFTRRTIGPSADASPTPTQSLATEGPTGVPSTPQAIGAPVWLATGNMITPHAFHTSTLLRDGGVLVAGGVINDHLDGQVSASTELYDPTSGSWTATGGMTEARWGHTATLLRDGRVLVAGSYINSGDPLASAELYDPDSGRWTATGNMNTGRGGHTATLLPDGRVLVVGGGAEDTRLEGGPRSATAELYDPGSGKWVLTASMGEARIGHSATLLRDGSVLVVGGSGNFLTAELFSPSTGKWIATGSTSTPQGVGHTATLLLDGRVLVAGGNPGSDIDPLATAELYNPDRGRWTATASMATARSWHTATLLSDGRVLVVGNTFSGDGPASAELYDPTRGQWTVTASPARARFGHTATLLPDDRVLLTGDYDDNSRASAELYDPGNGS